MPKISVIVPVYKVENYLHKCVDSILAQTFSDFECILVDDGSPDKCGAICDEYALKDARVKVVHKQNSGVSSARNVGLEFAQGEYVTFVDSDDWLNIHMLQFLYDALVRSAAEVAVCQYSFKNDEIYDDTVLGEIVENVIHIDKRVSLKNVMDSFQISVWAKLYRKEVFDKIRFSEELVWGEDEHLRPYILYQCNAFVGVEYPLYYYRIIQSSITRSNYTFKKVDSFQKMYKDHLKLYKQKKDKVMYAETARKKCDSYLFDDIYIRVNRRDLWKEWKAHHKGIKFFLLKELFHNRICLRKKFILFLMLFGTKAASKQLKKYYPELISV